MCMHVYIGAHSNGRGIEVWRLEETLGCWSLPAGLFETVSSLFAAVCTKLAGP